MPSTGMLTFGGAHAPLSAWEGQAAGVPPQPPPELITNLPGIPFPNWRYQSCGRVRPHYFCLILEGRERSSLSDLLALKAGLLDRYRRTRRERSGPSLRLCGSDTQTPSDREAQ